MFAMVVLAPVTMPVLLRVASSRAQNLFHLANTPWRVVFANELPVMLITPWPSRGMNSVVPGRFHLRSGQ